MKPLDENALRAAAFDALIAYALRRDHGMVESRPTFALSQAPGKPTVTRVARLSVPQDAHKQLDATNSGSFRTVALPRAEQARLREAFRAEQRRQRFRPTRKSRDEIQFTLGPVWWDGAQTALVKFGYWYHFDDPKYGDGGYGSSIVGGLFLRKDTRGWKLLQVEVTVAAG
jgi:hypothetical protein